MYAEWASKKCEIALRLASGECGGSYEEAVIILCAAISGLAAQVWPGDGKDRVRFVEVLKEFAPAEIAVTQISVPILVDVLRHAEPPTACEGLEKSLVDFGPTRVLTGQEVDKSEAEILAACGTVSTKEIRGCSYAALLYREIRCPYAHEYRAGSRADPSPMSGASGSLVSYVNWVHTCRHIHFHVELIAQLVLAIATGIDGTTTPRQAEPQQWWVNG
jgi:hypothetical protein